MNKVYDIKLQDNEWLVFVFFKMSCHAFQKNALAASSEDVCADVAGLPWKHYMSCTKKEVKRTDPSVLTLEKIPTILM